MSETLALDRVDRHRQTFLVFFFFLLGAKVVVAGGAARKILLVFVFFSFCLYVCTFACKKK